MLNTSYNIKAINNKIKNNQEDRNSSRKTSLNTHENFVPDNIFQVQLPGDFFECDSVVGLQEACRQEEMDGEEGKKINTAQF